MSDPVFKEGDEVEFEIGAGTNRPRWWYWEDSTKMNKDNGASNIWASGVVVHPREIPSVGVSSAERYNKYWIYVKFEITNMIGSAYTAFPRSDINKSYNEWQWARKGFLRHKLTCQCGSETVYGKDTTLHSHWCAKASRRN